MNVLRLMLREIQHRKLNFLSATVAVTVAVTLLVAIVTMCEASKRETARLMRDLGFNVLIVPEGVDMADFWSEDFAVETMPEEYVHRLAASEQIHIQHLLARLQAKIEWRGRKIILTGLLPEVQPEYLQAKSKMIADIEPGTCWLGYELWHPEVISEGDEIDVDGTALRVAKCLGEKGSKDDVRIFAELHDVQNILGKPGEINEIEALSCECEGDRLATIRADLSRSLPDTFVTESSGKAIARAEMRLTVERYASFTMPAIALACALWVGVMALSNVRDRRQEIGVFRAVGMGSTPIGALFLGKAVLVGLMGAVLGFIAGTYAALQFGPEIFPMTAKKFEPIYSTLYWSLIGAPLVCVVASYLPTLQAILQDPAEVLVEE